MAIARPILGLAALIILAGGILLQFFVILSGATNGTPVGNVYFLQTTTNGISGTDAALPFDPPNNFGTETNVPDRFLGTNKFYYLSRFMFAFYIIALFFAVVAFFTSVLALCFRLGAYLTGLNTAIALFFQAITAALMTAWTVIGRNAFRSAGQDARLGRYAYGFTWAAFACFFISTILFCIGGSVGKNESSRSNKKSYFGRKKSTRSTRSRGSFIDSESQRRVKDEYE